MYSEKDYQSKQMRSDPFGAFGQKPLPSQQLEQINKVLFMNLKEFEKNRSVLAETSFARSSGRDDRSDYYHQKHPSFLDDDYSFGSIESISPKGKAVSKSADADCSSSLIESSQHSLDPPKLPPLVQLYQSRPKIANSSLFYVMKVSNIADDCTIQDVDDIFSPIPIIHGHSAPYYTECVHIIIRTLGKANSVVFVEFPTEELVKQALLHCQSRPVFKKRLLHVSYSTQLDLLKSLFPKFRVVDGAKSEIENGRIYVSRNEIMALLQQCRSIRQRVPGSSRRSSVVAERAIDMIVSILSKVPWHAAEEISTLQRDHLFELAKLSVEALMGETRSKVFTSHLPKLVRAALCVPLFTEKQKLMLLNASHISCPHELLMYVYTSDDNLCIHQPNTPCSCSTEATFHSENADSEVNVEITHSVIALQEDNEHTAIAENMQQRLMRADQLISSLRAEQHEVYRKYQDCLYDLNELQDKFDSLLSDHLLLQRQTIIRRAETLQHLQTPPQSVTSSIYRQYDHDFGCNPFEN